MTGAEVSTNGLRSPFSLIAELTHRCPLHCLYCSNPLEMQKSEHELTTEEWKSVFRQAAKLGIFHLHLTGGEPLARKDLAELIAAAREAGLYVNMITSGVGLTEERLATLVAAGLEHLQLSFQDLEEASANHIAGTKAHAIKLGTDSYTEEIFSRVHDQPGGPSDEPGSAGGVHPACGGAWA